MALKEQNRWEISPLEQNYKVIEGVSRYHELMSQTASHVSVCLLHVSDSFIPKGPWELLWLVQAHRPVFGSVKLAALIKYENSFVPRHMTSDEGLFWKSSSRVVILNSTL